MASSRARYLSILADALNASGQVTSNNVLLPDTGVTAGSYGSASQVPVLTIDSKGRVTSASTTSVAGVTTFGYNTGSGRLTINTADGGTFTADVTLAPFTTSNLAEGTNQYFTTARARSSISASGSLSYNSTTGALTYTQDNTDTVPEGALNLYYTSARARGALSYTTGSAGYNSTSGQITIPGTTSHITEGSNLFYTDARARASISAGTGVTYDSSTGVVSIGQSTGTTDNVTFGNVTVNGTLTSDDITSTNITASGNLTVSGDLTVSGTTTTVNSTTVSVADINIELARNATTAAQANGGGLTITGPATAATLTYSSADDRWNFNKDLNVGRVYGNLTGAVTGNASTASTLATSRSFTITGDGSWTVNFDGSTNVSGALTLANSGVTAGSYGSGTAIPVITVDAKGRVTAASTTSVTIGDGAMTVTAGTGLTGGGQLGTANQTGATSVTLSLATAGTAGTYTKVTTDAYGRVTTGTTLSASDIPSLSGTYLPLTGGTLSGAINWGTSLPNAKKIIGIYQSGNLWTGIGMSSTTASPQIAGDATVTTLLDIGYYTNDATQAWTSAAQINKTSITVGGNTVWHAGNLTNLNQLTNGPGYLTGTKVDSITATSPIVASASTGAVTLSHANSGVTAGTYNNVTVNALGHVTSGSNTSYLTSYTETDTLATVTARGASTSTASTFSGGITANVTGTLVSPNGSTVTAADSAMPSATNSMLYTLGYGPSGNDGHIIGMTWTSSSVYGAQMWLDTDPTNRMAIRSRNSSGVWNGWSEVLTSNNISSYAVTAEADTLATVTARGATTSSVVRINNQLQVGQNTNGTAYIDAYGGYAWFGRDSNTAGIRIDGSGNVHTTGTLNSAGALTQNGNQVLHAGNYQSYLGDYTYGSYRVIADYSGSSTWYIRSNGNYVFGRAHDWTQAFTLNLGNGTAASNNGWAEFGQNTSNNAAGTWFGTRFVQYTGSAKIDGYVRASRYYLGDDTNYITSGGSGAIRSQTSTGYIDVGSMNASYAHIQTDRPQFYFNKDVYIDGQLYKYSGGAYLHTGNYNSYAPTLTGGNASGTWNISISGSAANITGNLTSDGWVRTVGDSTQLKFYGNSRTMIYRTDGNTNDHGGGGYAHIFYYGGSADANRKFIINTDGRLYSPYHGWLDTMSVAYASNSGTVAGLSVHTDRNNAANQIVRTDSYGYIQAGWINTTSGDSGVENRLSRIYSSYDNYLRYSSLTDFKVHMGLSAKNNFSRRIDYTSDSNYWVGSMGVSNWFGGADEAFHGGSGFFDIWSGTNFPSGLSHIHGINMVHYTTNSFGSTGGNAYGWQLAAQYDTNSGPWWRRVSGGSFSGWMKIWHDSNDGSGSGLDADLLDGNDSSVFARCRGEGTNYVDYARYVYSSAHGYWVNPRDLYVYYSDLGRQVYDDNSYGGGSGWKESSQLGVKRAQRANGNFYIDDNYGVGVVGSYSSYRYQTVFTMGSSWGLPADGTTTGNLYGIAWSHPNAGGTAGNLDSHGLLVLINGGFGSAMSYSIKASGNITAYSDERLKTNWRDLTANYVAKLARVKTGIYDRTDAVNITQVGVSAQSLREVLPEAIVEAEDDMKTLGVNYGNAALASAIMLAREVEDLKSQVKSMQEIINKLMSKLGDI